ncbi:MAG: TetR family transcriptional regulator [Hyphomicrobiales bacterium]|nr:TetR family transcriptional regulator [Hyphomicrobiales bacterium]
MAVPKLTDEQQAARRTHILDAAERCFSQHGFHRSTMQMICKEAGISAGALYVYFPSKETLIEGLTERDRQEIMARFAGARGGKFMDVVEAILRGCILAQPQEKACLCIEIGSEATRNPAIAAAMHRFDSSIRGSLRQLIEQAVALGQIAPVAPLDDVVLGMAMIGDGLFWRRAVDPGFDAERALPHIMSMVATLVRPLETSSSDTPVSSEIAP